MRSSERISNQVIIQNILKYFKNKGYEGLTARPWNYYKPDSTLWWLVPSTEWPSYKYGKLVLFSRKEGYGVGFNIEKGISEIAAQMLSSKSARKLCTKPDWAWNDFVSDLSSGVFEDRLKAISDTAKMPLRISIQASNVTSEYDPYSEKIEGLEIDHIMSFEYKDGDLKVLQDELKGEMRKYAKVAKLTDLIGVFQEKELEWCWIDINITFDVKNDDNERLAALGLVFIKTFANYFNVNF